MMKLAYAAALFLPLALAPVHAETLTFTGTTGGTVEKARTCDRVEGTATCVVDSIYTTANGKVATKKRERTTADGTSTAVITFTNPKGETRTRERSFSRN